MVIRGHSWSLVVTRGHSWSLVVIRGHSWSFVVIRGHSWSLVCTFRQNHYHKLFHLMCSFIFGLGSKFFTRISKIWQFYCPKEHVLKTCTVNVFAVTCWPLWVLHVTALVILHKTIWIFLQPFPLQSMKLNLFLPEVRWPLIDYKSRASWYCGSAASESSCNKEYNWVT